MGVMKLSKIHCEVCGGNLDMDELSQIKNQKVICPYCGSIYINEAKHSVIGAKLESDIEHLKLIEKKENTKEFWSFQKLKENNKSALKSLAILMGISLTGFLILSANYLIERRPGQLEVTTNEKNLRGENYKIVSSKFEDMGFKNIKYEKVNDLKIGFFADEGDVKEVTINGSNAFEKGSHYSQKSKIKIYYHVFPK